jgi:hypothetical protein
MIIAIRTSQSPLQSHRRVAGIPRPTHAHSRHPLPYWHFYLRLEVSPLPHLITMPLLITHSTQYHAHWIAPNIGAVIVAIGLIIGFQCSQAYTTDVYQARYAASAASVGAFLRTMCGFSFPLFAPKMYETLGLGWGNSLLAFLTLGVGIVGPLGLWVYGERLRKMSWRGLDQSLIQASQEDREDGG